MEITHDLTQGLVWSNCVCVHFLAFAFILPNPVAEKWALNSKDAHMGFQSSFLLLLTKVKELNIYMICLECGQNDLAFNIFKPLVLGFPGRAEGKAAVIPA